MAPRLAPALWNLAHAQVCGPLVFSKREKAVLIFIDESGHPNPGDPSTRPVLLAVCVKESDAGTLIRRLFSLRRDLLGKMTLSRAEEELKATELLSRGPLRKNVAKREFVETLFEYLRDFPITIFAIVMERPTERPYRGSEVLQRQYWWLLERVNRFVATDHPGHMAIPIFDGQDPTSNRVLSDSFTAFMARTAIGQAMDRIVPTLLFTDSSLTPGLQIADLCAYVLRVCHEQELFRTRNVTDPYLSAINRYAKIIKEKSVDYEHQGFDGTLTITYGIRKMAISRFIYRVEEVIEQVQPSLHEEGQAAEIMEPPSDGGTTEAK
jgi:Protein of unknown function (DUF3800)